MSEPPSSDGPTARSDAATRLAELLGDVMAEPAGESAGEPERDTAPVDRPTAVPKRRLRRRDLLRDDPGEPSTPVGPAAGDEPPTEPVPVAADEGPADDADEVDEVADEVLAGGEEGYHHVLAMEPEEALGRTEVPDEPPTEEVVAVPATAGDTTGDTTDARRARRVWAAGAEPVVDGLDDETDHDGEGDEGVEVAATVLADGDEDDAVGAASAARARPRGQVAEAPASAEPVRLPRVTLRAVAFGTVLALLIAAIPALGWIGKERLLASRGGEVVDSDRQPSEPGYLAVVEPTPTALVVHRDADGVPTSAAVLSLGAGDTGGSVLLVPLTLQVHQVVYFNRIIDGYEQLGDLDAFRKSIEDVLGVAIPAPTIELSDDDLATLVAPVAPLHLDVSRPVMLDDGTAVSGPTEIGADQIGAYLRASDDSESEVARLERVRDVWTAWLDAIGESASDEPIGAAATGIGSFVRVLADGPHVTEVLDVQEGELVYGAAPYLVPAEGFNEQVIDAVPLPASPRPGRRFTIKLLNGDAGEDLPMSLVRELVLAGGAVEWVGNAEELGQSDSLVEYAGDGRAQEAELIGGLLGGADVEQMSTRRAEAEGVDLVITAGADLIEEHSS